MALRAVIEHPKFARLKQLLKLNRACTLGYLEGLWHFCGRFTPAGDLGKYSDVDVEAWLEWDGEEGALIAAYVKAGWLDVHEAYRYVVHDWHKHADDATRLALKRAGTGFASVSVPSTQKQPIGEVAPMVSGHVATVSGLPVPEPEPVPVPESEALGLSGEGYPEEPVAKLQLVSGKFHAVTRLELEAWELAFPAVDVRAELLRIVCWLDANKNKRSSSVTGSKKRVYSWLQRTQDKGGSGGANQQHRSRGDSKIDYALRELDEANRRAGVSTSYATRRTH